VAAVAVTPIAGAEALPAATDPIALLAGAGVGLASSVIPYLSDQMALARLPRATYALMVSLLPAVATLIGVVVLTQVPDAREVLGVALVIAGVALHRPAGAPDAGQPGASRARRRGRPRSRRSARPGTGGAPPARAPSPP
jgi:inner membrane transporter RhtA